MPSSLADCFFWWRLLETAILDFEEELFVLLKELYLLLMFDLGSKGFEGLLIVCEGAKRAIRLRLAISGDVSIELEVICLGLYDIELSIGGSANNELLIAPVIWYSWSTWALSLKFSSSIILIFSSVCSTFWLFSLTLSLKFLTLWSNCSLLNYLCLFIKLIIFLSFSWRLPGLKSWSFFGDVDSLLMDLFRFPVALMRTKEPEFLITRSSLIIFI